jgi:hypothetical protein
MTIMIAGLVALVPAGAVKVRVEPPPECVPPHTHYEPALGVCVDGPRQVVQTKIDPMQL